MLPEQIGKGLVGQFLKRRHPVARQLGQLGKRVIVEGNQFAQARSLRASGGCNSMIGWGIGSGRNKGRVPSLLRKGDFR